MRRINLLDGGMTKWDGTQLNYPALVLDASAGTVFVGIVGPDEQWIARQQSTANALEGLFASVEYCLQTAGMGIDSIRGFIYCEGPGSVLGLRLCAMAIETWRRIAPRASSLHRYTLQLCARLIRRDAPPASPALLLSDWKKAFGMLRIEDSAPHAVEPCDTAALATLELPCFTGRNARGGKLHPRARIQSATNRSG